MTAITSKIKNIVVGNTISAYFMDGNSIATMKPHRLMEILAELNQWTFPVERTSVEGAAERVQSLGKELKAEVTVTGDNTFKFKVSKDTVKTATAPAAPKHYIRLGKDAIFDNVEAAFNHVKSVAKTPAPANIINGLTKTFEKGSVEGQVKSVFHDVYTHGVEVPAVAQKVRDFQRLTDADSRYDALRAAVKAGQPSTETESVTTTFKYGFLIAIAKELPAPAPAEAPAAAEAAVQAA